MTAHRFVLRREKDPTGVSGVGVVAEGVEFSDGVVALRWLVPEDQPGHGFPTSVVFHDNGMESVERIHGHGGSTKVEWLDRNQSDYACICGVGAGEAAVCPVHTNHWVR